MVNKKNNIDTNSAKKKELEEFNKIKDLLLKTFEEHKKELITYKEHLNDLMKQNSLLMGFIKRYELEENYLEFTKAFMDWNNSENDEPF
jgi:hypothetical protein